MRHPAVVPRWLRPLVRALFFVRHETRDGWCFYLRANGTVGIINRKTWRGWFDAEWSDLRRLWRLR